MLSTFNWKGVCVRRATTSKTSARPRRDASAFWTTSSESRIATKRTAAPASSAPAGDTHFVTANRSTARGSARGEVLARAWDLIADGGVGAFSIRDAAAATGVSVGTVTYHFANRERLLDEAFTALAERHDTIARVAITSARTGTRDEARTTLVYALHHLWGERTITLAAAELRIHATRSRAARASAEAVADTCRSVVAELHRITDRPPVSTPSQAVDLLDAAAVRLAVGHRSTDNFRVAVRRHVNGLYLHS